MRRDDRPAVTIDTAIGVDGWFHGDDWDDDGSLDAVSRANLARLARLRASFDATMTSVGGLFGKGWRADELPADEVERKAVVASALDTLDRSQVQALYVAAEALDEYWIFVPRECSLPSLADLRAAGVHVVELGRMQVDLAGALGVLGRAGVRTLFVAGDSMLQAALISAGLIDEVIVRIVPTLRGIAGQPSPLTAATTPVALALTAMHELGEHELVLYYTVL